MLVLIAPNYLQLLKLPLEHSVFVFSIANIISSGALEIKNFVEKVRKRLISQLIKDISRVSKTLPDIATSLLKIS